MNLRCAVAAELELTGAFERRAHDCDFAEIAGARGSLSLGFRSPGLRVQLRSERGIRRRRGDGPFFLSAQHVDFARRSELYSEICPRPFPLLVTEGCLLWLT
jgi:hypothetical protein